MKEFKIYILLIAFAFGFTSCLDKFPEDALPTDKALKTVDDASQAAIGIYNAFLNPALYSGDLTLLPDIQADFVQGVIGNTNTYGDIWRWNIQATDRNVEGVYAALYDVIGRCNFLLQFEQEIRNNTFNDEDLDRLDQYCGEAYFARALAYSELIKCFCKSYESDDAAKQELGIVIRKKFYSDEPLVRANLFDSYQFVLSDLDIAAELLKMGEDYDPYVQGPIFNSPYFTEFAVYALRARISLYMKHYEDAIKYATMVIQDNESVYNRYYLLSNANNPVPGMKGVNDFSYMWMTDNATEIIWKVGFTATAYGGALGQVFFNFDYRSCKPDYIPAQWILNLYASNDLRATTYFKSHPSGYTHSPSLIMVEKYWGNMELFQQNQRFHLCMPKVFRLAEQYLIRAEAYCNLPSPDYGKAGKDISTLRAARYSDFGGSTPMDASNAMKLIEEERIKELYMEGFRLQDLKRWHKGFERKPMPNTLENGNHIRIEKDNDLFVWPIPKHELESQGSQIQPNDSNK